MNRAELLAAFEPLRVADVRDALDTLGYTHAGSVSAEVRPLWRTRVHGIARTARYLPYAGPQPPVGEAEYGAWSGWYYGNVCPYPWVESLEAGDFVALDCSGVDAGLMGSENTLACVRRGAVGFVTNSGMRDTDELILQRVPFWSRFVSKSMVQSRLQFDAMDGPIAVGGATVFPGDVLVADGDGVVVVPRAIAGEVARLATAELRRDQEARRRHYEALGLPPDGTLT